MAKIITIDDQLALLREAKGPPIGDSASRQELLEEMMGYGVRTAVVPLERFDPAFFDLRTGMAGELHQKLVTYRMALIVLGDITDLTDSSRSLRDYVRESNRRGDVRFLAELPGTAI